MAEERGRPVSRSRNRRDAGARGWETAADILRDDHQHRQDMHDLIQNMITLMSSPCPKPAVPDALRDLLKSSLYKIFDNVAKKFAQDNLNCETNKEMYQDKRLYRLAKKYL